MADTIRGQFVWHDLVTPNTAGAHEFYAKAVGWKTETWDKDQSYQMFSAPSGPIGGTVENRSLTPHWLAYIGTANVDATVETAMRLGAKVLTAAQPLPNGGRYATLADPHGAAFGVYASETHAGDSSRAPQIGEFSWHELATIVAPSEAFKFYAELFAWDEIAQYDMGPIGPYLIFGRDGRQLGGIFNNSATGKQGSAYWLGYVKVGDLEGAVEQSKTARATVLTGPMAVPGGDRIATLMDPYGAFFALHMAAGLHPAAKPAATKSTKPSKAAKPAKAAAQPASKSKPARNVAPPKKAKKAKPTARKPAKKKAAAKKKPARKTVKQKPKAKVKAKAKKKGRR